MINQNLSAVIKDHTVVESYILFREMEEWCYENLPIDRWRLDWSSTATVYGVDIPTVISFTKDSDLTAFKMRFSISS